MEFYHPMRQALTAFLLYEFGVWELVFRPEQTLVEEKGKIDLDFLAGQTEEIFQGNFSDVLDELLSFQ
jgi:hypothetical protein